MTPFYVACDKGHYEIVQLLLDHGVQVDIPDEVSDISCIHVVSYIIQPKLIKLLWSQIKISHMTFVSLYVYV